MTNNNQRLELVGWLAGIKAHNPTRRSHSEQQPLKVREAQKRCLQADYSFDQVDVLSSTPLRVVPDMFENQAEAGRPHTLSSARNSLHTSELTARMAEEQSLLQAEPNYGTRQRPVEKADRLDQQLSCEDVRSQSRTPRQTTEWASLRR